LTTEEAHYWDAVGEVWRRTSPQSLWRAHSDAVNAALLARWLPSTRVERLLKTDLFDEAFGDGLYPQLVRSAQHMVGIDLSAAIVRADLARYPGLQVAVADVRRLPFASSSFDVIVSNSTLDHFRSPHEIVISLCELHRILRVGGQLLLTLDNLANPVIALRNALPFRWLNRLRIVPYYVGATCGPRRLSRILEQVGFDIAEVRVVMHCPRVVAVKLAQILEGWIGPEMQRCFLRCLMTFEGLSHWRTRFLTGHFVAVKAMRR
jgi:SAM-dependent methyltransferase